MSTEALGRYMLICPLPNDSDNHGVWRILNTRSETPLGVVEWYGPWQRYVLGWVNTLAIFDAQCHRDIADFLDKVNAEHKVQKGLRQAAQTEPAVFGAPIPPEEG